MKKLLIGLVGILFLTSANAQQVNDANAEVREAKNYHGINVSSSFDVYLTQGGEEAVAVSASETKYRDRIKVEVKDGILHVKYDSEGKFWNTGNKKLKAYISFKDIDKLTISGACDVFINGTLKATKLDLDQSGASDLKGRMEIAGDLDVHLSGASDILVSGSSSNLKINVSGASTFKGFDFISENCNAKASGASDIKITVNKEINAHASGASDVRFKGSAVIRDMKTSGASSVSKS
jgi:hypothetical protein